MLRVGFTSEIRVSEGIARIDDDDDDTADAADAPRELNSDAIVEGLLMTRDDLLCWLGVFETRPAVAFDGDPDAGGSGTNTDFDATAEGLLRAILDAQQLFPWRSRGKETCCENKKGSPLSELERGLSMRYI